MSKGVRTQVPNFREVSSSLKFSPDSGVGVRQSAEFDRAGNIVGLGVTLVPTSHRVQLGGKPLYTWCAFDTVLFPPSLGQTAHVSSTCPSTEQPITFVATPEGVVRDLTPSHSVMSLIIPANRQDCVRATFCEQSLFFSTAQAASSYLAAHPEAVLLSIEEAAVVGKRVAASRFVSQRSPTSPVRKKRGMSAHSP